MKDKCKVTVLTKEHFLSLIKDFRKTGFYLVTLGEKFAELESESEFVIIEIV